MMATISTGIQLYDKVSAPINNMLGALNNMLHVFESVDNSMNGAFNTAEIDEARNHVQQATAQVVALGQEIEDNEQKQDGFNKEVEEGTDAMDGLANGIMGAVGAYASLQGLQKLVELSDTYVQTTARLDMMNDGLQTTDELQNMIFASAQRSRASYQATADAVSKLGLNAGEAFDSTQEIVAFAEQLNKQFVIAGTEASSMEGAMTQLVQALGAGALRGDELNSIFEAAPNLIRTIADYMGVPIGEIKELASQGKITADIVKTAMLSAAEETNANFEAMPMTWGQVWTSVMNRLYMASQPLLKAISWLADKWSIIEPIALGVAAALLVYLAATKGVELATKAWTAAQTFFNSVMALNPIFLIIMGIILLISLIYAVVAAINKVTGKSINATGMIVGALMTAVAFIWNLFLGLLDIVLAVVNWMWNRWAMFANFFANLFNDPIGSIIHLFGDMADNILGILENIAKAMDKLFGSNMAGTIQGWRSSLDSLVEGAANKYGNGSYEKVVEELNLSSESLGLKRWAYTDAYNKGYGWGEKAGDAVADALDTSSLAEDMAETAENTGKSAKSLEVTSEDLKYLRDIAERETINRFTTAEIKVDMKNTNTINSNMDLDGIVDYLANGVNEAMEKAAEGVYA